MSKYNTAQFKSGAPGYTDVDLSGLVVSTLDFGSPYRPVFCREVVPGDKWSIDLSCFCRLSSMVLPTFGRAKIVNRFFYVPFSIIHDFWHAFEEGRQVSIYEESTGMTTQLAPEVPHVTNYQLAKLFVRTDLDNSLATIVTSGAYDFHLYDNSSPAVAHDYKFTRYGRVLYYILTGLGYEINFAESDGTQMSALPLIAFLKVSFDWLVDSHFVNSIDVDVESLFHLYGGQVDTDVLAKCLDSFVAFYEKDYFTSAWQKPNQVDGNTYGNPLPGQAFAYNVDNSPNGTANYGYVYNTANAASIKTTPYSSNHFISDYGLRLLESVSSFVRKRLLTGFRHDKQLEADFNLKIDPEITHRSYYIGSLEVPIQISDVMATTKNSDVELGEYAGKGIGFRDGRFYFEPKNPERGVVICVAAIVPDVHYGQGRNRELFHLKISDFYNAAFEDVGPQTIRNDELYARFHDNQEYTNAAQYGGKADGVFGYAPRYGEYQSGSFTDKLLGDFSVPTLNQSGAMDCYHFFRLFKIPSSTHPLSNTYSFKSTADATQFARIFNVTSDVAEHFTISWDFNVHVQRRMLPINSLPDVKGYGDYVKLHHVDDLLNG